MFEISYSKSGEKRSRKAFIAADTWKEAQAIADKFCADNVATLGTITKVKVINEDVKK